MNKKYNCVIEAFELKFIEPVETSRDKMSSRIIYTIRIEDNFGRYGIGEIAPLNGLSQELKNLSEFQVKLSEVEKNIEYFLHNKLDLLNYPSILFGIESAWMSYKNKDSIFYKTPFTTEGKSIPINALVWMGDYEKMKSQVDQILKKEVQCIKLKIGGIELEKEIDLLAYIRKYRSEKTLDIRLDANGAFSGIDALEKLKLLSEYKIHSIEQPIKPNQIELLKNIIQLSPIPIALDEELIGKNTYKDKWNLLETVKPHFVVIKPSLHGGIIGSEEWIFIAKQMNIMWWATSALESNIGLNAIAQWCSRYDESYTTPQGLGTGNLYLNNYPSNLSVVNYNLTLKNSSNES